MSDETNKIIHERLMGRTCWHELEEVTHRYCHPEGYEYKCKFCPMESIWRRDAIEDVEPNPLYDSDLNLAFAAQAVAIERFGEIEYIQALLQLTVGNGITGMRLVASTAEQRCLAITKLLEGEK